MIRFVWIFVLAILLLAAGTVLAGEIYQYTDKDGNLIFTDDMSKVPEDQQAGVNVQDAFDLAPSPPAEVSDADEEAVDTAPEIEPPDADIAAEPDTGLETDQAFDEDEETDAPSVPAEDEDFEAQTDDTMFETAPDEQAEVTASGEAFGKEEKAPEINMTPAELEAKNTELEQALDKLREEQNRLSSKSPEIMRGDQLTSYQEAVQEFNARLREHKVKINRFQQQVARFNKRIKRMQLKEREKQQRSEEAFE